MFQANKKRIFILAIVLQLVYFYWTITSNLMNIDQSAPKTHKQHICQNSYAKNIWKNYRLFERAYKEFSEANHLILSKKLDKIEPCVRIRNNLHYFILDPQRKTFLDNVKATQRQVKPILLLNLVTVSASSFKKRIMIRNTWGDSRAYKGAHLTRTLFMCGLSSDQEVNKKLSFESYVYNDIIQADFMDTYKNLTYKSLLALKWATSYYDTSTLKFILKIDDDVVPNMPLFVSYLKEIAEKKLKGHRNSFIGYPFYKMDVSRNKTNKFYMPESDFNRSFYPVYTMGLGYVVTTDLAMKISRIEDHAGYIYIEDIYVTGILGGRFNASYIDLVPRYNLWTSPKVLVKLADYSKWFFFFPLSGKNFTMVSRYIYNCYYF